MEVIHHLIPAVQDVQLLLNQQEVVQEEDQAQEELTEVLGEVQENIPILEVLVIPHQQVHLKVILEDQEDFHQDQETQEFTVVAAEVPADLAEPQHQTMSEELVVQEVVAIQEIQQQELAEAAVLVDQPAAELLDQVAAELVLIIMIQVQHHLLIEQELQTQAVAVDQAEDLQDPLIFYMEVVAVQEL